MDGAEIRGQDVLAPSLRLRRLAGVLTTAGAAFDLQKIGVPEGEPACHWFFVMPAGMDSDHPDPDAPFGHGTSFSSETEALERAFGEFAERWCLSRDDQARLNRASYRDLVGRGIRSLDPRTIAGLSDEFRQAHSKHRISDETELAWVEGRTFPFWQKMLVSVQLVYVPYASGRGESRIRQPLTTGAAFGWSFAQAFWQGFAEVLERDAFMIAWLARLSPPRIELSLVRDSVVR